MTLTTDTKPRLGLPVMVRTADEHDMEFIALRQWFDDPWTDDDGQQHAGYTTYVALPGQKHPECWSGGQCWAENENQDRSAPVIGWRELTAEEMAALPKEYQA